MTTSTFSSRISGFHKQSFHKRVETLASYSQLTSDEQALLRNTGNLQAEMVDRLIENAIGTMNIPIGIATNMRIDGVDRLIPMATEESSVVAAVCNAARQCYDNGGFTTSMSGSSMIAQIQLTGISNPDYARQQILERRVRWQPCAMPPILCWSRWAVAFRAWKCACCKRQSAPW